MPPEDTSGGKPHWAAWFIWAVDGEIPEADRDTVDYPAIVAEAEDWLAEQRKAGWRQEPGSRTAGMALGATDVEAHEMRAAMQHVLGARAVAGNSSDLAERMAASNRAHVALVTTEDLAELTIGLPAAIATQLMRAAQALNSAIRSQWSSGRNATPWRDLVNRHISRAIAKSEDVRMPAQVVRPDGSLWVTTVTVNDSPHAGLPTYLGGRKEPIVSPRIDAALSMFVATLRLIHEFDPRTVVAPSVVRAVNANNAKNPRRRGLKNGGKATAAEGRYMAIWQYLEAQGFLSSPRGAFEGFVSDAQRKFNTSRATVVRAIRYGKGGLFDAGAA